MRGLYYPELETGQRIVGKLRPETASVFVVCSLALLLARPSPGLFLAVGFFCVTFLLSSETRLRTLVRRLAAPTSIAMAVFLVQSLSRGGEALWRFRWAGITISVYRNGLLAGSMIAGRVLTASLLIVFLSLTVPVQDFLILLRRMGIPGFLTALCLMVYRFSFLILEEASRIKQAQQVRLGYANFAKGMRSVALLGSSLVLRVHERADRVCEAARTRGAGASFPPPPWRGFGKEGFREALLLATTLGIFAVAGWFLHA